MPRPDTVSKPVPDPEQTVALLESTRRGKRAAARELMELLHDELRIVARRFLATERPDHTLQPTALVNEACLRLLAGRTISCEGRTHFRALGARVMKHVLIDHARRKKLDPADRVSLVGLVDSRELIDALALVELLDRLREVDARRARVVEERFFGGLSTEEIASLHGVTPRTIRNDLRFAKAWLKSKLTERGQ